MSVKIKNELRLSKTMNFGTRNCVVLCTLNIKFLNGWHVKPDCYAYNCVRIIYLTQSRNMLKGKKNAVMHEGKLLNQNCVVLTYTGAFNNYVDKKRGRRASQKSTLVHPGGGA